MDKFGIFNMLSSLLDFYNKQNSKSSPARKGDLPSNPTDFINGLSALFPSLKNNSTSKEPSFSEQSPNASNKKGLEQKEQSSGGFPLQDGMLSTMKSHDDFVKRVTDKHTIK